MSPSRRTDLLLSAARARLHRLTPEEALGEDIQAEFIGGRGDLVRQALAHVGWGR